MTGLVVPVELPCQRRGREVVVTNVCCCLSACHSKTHAVPDAQSYSASFTQLRMFFARCPQPLLRSGSGSCWSAHTGLASLFDAHLTEALRHTGAVRTFKRAMQGVPLSLSRRTTASSFTSQLTGAWAPDRCSWQCPWVLWTVLEARLSQMQPTAYLVPVANRPGAVHFAC